MQKEVKGVITGASTGIGKALALKLARDFHASLVLNARGEDDLEAAAREVRDAGGKAITVAGSVADADVCKKMLDTCRAEFGGINVLVNNAGLTRSGPMTKLTLDDWRFVFEVNFFAALNLTYAVLPDFTEQGHGKIINVASVAGKVAFPGTICYSASKFALTGMSEGMAAEFAGKIDVITVCPGWVRTEFFKRNNIGENPTSIAEESNLRGWLMKNVLSISSEQAANDIVKAMAQGGSHELVLTAPGVMVERMSSLFPELTSYLSSLIPADRGASKKKEREGATS